MAHLVRSWAVFAIVFCAGWLTSAAQASFPCGIYARVDKVEVGPDADKPTWVKLYGDFIVIKTSGRLEDVSRGYLYFNIVKDKEQHCRIEWNDLKEIAKSTQYVAFGSVHSEPIENRQGDWQPQVYGPRDKDPKPIPYPLNLGLSRLRTRNDLFGSADNPDPAKVNPVLRLQRYLKQHPLDK